MKILFLDFDGVLNSQRSVERFKSFQTFCPNCMANLNKILDETGAAIVVTSSWRIHMTIEGLRQMLQEQGLRYPERVMDRTPEISTAQRAEEIRVWLEANRQLPVESFVIVDDLAVGEGFHEHQVQTSFDQGLHAEAAAQVVKILMKPDAD